MRSKIKKIRHLLINSIVRAYYIAFIAKQEIQQLDESLNAVEREIIGDNGQKPLNLGRNSMIGSSSNGQDAIVRLQNNFTNIFNYLT
jgi:predicted O-linked N-acetylglucosamine transferase (SPINDLY family)